MVTINPDTPTPPDEEKPPDPKKPRIITPPANCSAAISNTELLAVRQLIQGWHKNCSNSKVYVKLLSGTQVTENRQFFYHGQLTSWNRC